MSVTDVEVSRAQRARDDAQRPAPVRAGRAALAVDRDRRPRRQPKIVVRVETGDLLDAEGNVLARVRRTDDHWIGERVGSPLGGGYIPG